MNKIDNSEYIFTNEFIQLLEEKIEALRHKAEIVNDELEKINYRIDLFYTEEDVFAGRKEIAVTQELNDKIIDRKIDRYKIIIDLIVQRYLILKQRIQDNYYTDPLDLANAKIDLFKAMVEIRAKEEFLNKYRERKKIYNKMQK